MTSYRLVRQRFATLALAEARPRTQRLDPQRPGGRLSVLPADLFVPVVARVQARATRLCEGDDGMLRQRRLRLRQFADAT